MSNNVLILKDMDSFHQPTAPNEHYHVYNRGNHKQPTFLDENDYRRFLFLVLATQSPIVVNNTSRMIKDFFQNIEHVGHSMSNNVPADDKLVKVIAFCFMPNHFHLILEEIKEHGIPEYMQKLGNAYTKYFNTKYKTKGHLFEGRYGRIHISDNTQLLHTSAYIHRNPRELPEWQNKESEYLWSSYQDYVQKNRWDTLLSQEIILEQFNEQQPYKNFVDTSTTKLTDAEESMLK